MFSIIVKKIVVTHLGLIILDVPIDYTVMDNINQLIDSAPINISMHGLSLEHCMNNRISRSD